MLSKLRQYKYPREFRIIRTSISDTVTQSLYELHKELNQVKDPNTNNISQRDEKINSDQVKALCQTVIDLSLNVWRIKKRIDNKVGNGISEDEHRRLSRHVKNSIDLLIKGGFEVTEHDNEKNTGGESYLVIAYQHEKGLKEETVIETIKPTIYYKNKIILRGEVIVGQPEDV